MDFEKIGFSEKKLWTISQYSWELLTVLMGDPCLRITLPHEVAPSRRATLESSGEIPQAIDPSWAA